MAPLFESGKMEVRSLPPQFCFHKAAKLCSCSPTGRGCRLKNGFVVSWSLTRSINFYFALVAQLVEVADLKSVYCVGSSPTKSINGV